MAELWASIWRDMLLAEALVVTDFTFLCCNFVAVQFGSAVHAK